MVLIYIGVGFLVGALALFGARRWIVRGGTRRPSRSRQVRERLPGRPELAGDRRPARVGGLPADLPVVRSRATELADRRAIRWKDPT